MAFIQWRRFNFFNSLNVDNSQLFDTWWTIKQKVLTCSSCGRGSLVFGDNEGIIHVVTHNFQINSFLAFQISVQHIIQLKQNNILAAIGIDEEGINPVVKVWNLDKKSKEGSPFCCRVQSTIPLSNEPSNVTAFAINESLTLMAVGFVQGSIVVYKGDVTKERLTSKSFQLSTEINEAVTGLSLHYIGKESFLFATTATSVMSFNLSGKSSKKRHLDNRGCPPLCCGMIGEEPSPNFFVAASDAVYLYDADSRGSCFAFEGEKLMCRSFNGFLVIAYKDKSKNSLPSTSSVRIHDKNVVVVYDLKLRLIVFSSPVPGVRELLYEWGSFYVLGADNTLLCLHEIDIHEKLEILFKKNMYPLAVKLAQGQDLGEEGLVSIRTQYADHLYSKADYDEAINQYCETIGFLEPSRVIRRFLDAQRINNLTTYLQELHQRGVADQDHTTLLLNCFTKLKDVDNLNKFILQPDTDLRFDVETAIRVCRQAGYCQHALRLAEKHRKHKWYLKIQLEDTRQYKQALEYIKQLSLEEAELSLSQYGKVLVDHAPHETTEFIKQLCSERSTGNEVEGFVMLSLEGQSLSGENFIPIFVGAPNMLVDFLEHLIKVKQKPSETVYTTLLEVYLDTMARNQEPHHQLEEKTLNLLKDFIKQKYSSDQALVLCQTLNFPPGILYLYEVSGLYQHILRFHMDHAAHADVVETCRRHGDKDSSLWQHALTYFAQRSEDECRNHVTQVLSHIDKYDLLPPLLVVQLLSKNSSATLSAIRDYILRRIRHESDAIEECERSIWKHRDESEKMKKQIDELKSSATIFQETKCSMCRHDLELPAVHFLCQHAYHQHCLEGYSDNEDECPACAGRNRRILDNLREQEQALSSSISLRDDFASQLRHSVDGFSVVADFFSKGFFNQLAVVSDVERSSRAPSSIEPSLQKELLMMQQSN